MMIRKATNEDIPAIVQLLKASLGDLSSTKSVEYWSWKHVHNPFGASPVLVAEEDGALIGIRAFMRWDWVEGKNVYRALRAVDTATHPMYQGKGIFKKLTLQMVETAEQEGYDFIFNSPNTQSTPGYLKMGWEVCKRLPLWLHVNPLATTFRPELYKSYHQNLLQANLGNLPLNQVRSQKIHTPIDAAFLSWRYQDCPVKQYALKTAPLKNGEVWIFFAVKKHKYGTELRVCNYLFSCMTDWNGLFNACIHLSKELGCRFLTLSAIDEVSSLQKIRYRLWPISKVSTIVTIRKLQNERVYNALKTLKWEMNTGDIELF